MRLTCPCCGATHSLEALLTDRAAREAVAAALELPAPLGGLLLRYLGLFRPRQHALSWERAAKLLTELQALVSAGQIERNGRIWPAPVDYWKSALDHMLQRREQLQLPLKTHGYLLEIIAGMSQKPEDQRAAQTEVEQERTRAREGARSGQMQAAAHTAQTVLPAATRPPATQDVTTTPDGAQIDNRTGEILTEQRPARTPPPPEFRAMLAKLQGKPLEPQNAP